MSQHSEEAVASSDTGHDDTNYNLVPLLRHFEEKRRLPRVDVRTDVVLTTAKREEVTVRMRDLSAEGMQVRCDPQSARQLHPRGTQIVGDSGPDVRVRFELRTGVGCEAFAVDGQLRYIAVRSPEEIAFGVKFTRVSLDTKKRLSAYLIDCMRPSE